ncbi:hypothetical protein ScPMuIL_012879 [Solemya velum]
MGRYSSSLWGKVFDGLLNAMTTSQPHNASEWQLYRVLQRANLLQYYDTFIAQGGDDVQQLCEAGEEEFLEIMALVGMASKPLHVRRLQKALQEWVANPAGFQGPSPVFVSTSNNTSASVSTPIREQQPVFPVQIHSNANVINTPTWSPHRPQSSVSPVAAAISASISASISQAESKEQDPKRHSSSPIPTPVLVESQINSIAQAAARIAKALPKLIEPKALSQKKQINRELQAVMQMNDDDPNRMDLLRKYAAIYGRFDSKRKNDKPMSLHEISVNEASAQLCRHIPALITRREDLFPLARQVVKESGYQYSKGHSRAEARDSSPKTVKDELDRVMTLVNKELAQLQPRLDELKSQLQASKEAGDSPQTQQLTTELEDLAARQVHLLAQQTELIRKQRRTERFQMNKVYGADEGDSSLASGSSSPGQNDSQDGEDFRFQGNLFASTILRAGQAGQGIIQNSLFDEGLRIAQQYGMDDFETELMELKRQKPEEDESDDSGEDSSVKSGSSGVLVSARRQNGDEAVSTNPENTNELESKSDSQTPKDLGKILVNGGQTKLEIVDNGDC